VLLVASDSELNLKEMVVIAFKEGLFPVGTRIDYVSLLDSLPSLSRLTPYDAVMCWTGGVPLSPVTMGNTLADYVDAGGGLVLAQYAFTIQSKRTPLAGRVMTDGYAPLEVDTFAMDLSNRQIDFQSLSFPLHPIFNGTDVLNLTYAGQADMSDPTLDETAILIAKDTLGKNAIAINAAGNIIGVDMLGGWWFGFEFDPYYRQLLANALLFVGGAF
jgi:hypothetical protein